MIASFPFRYRFEGDPQFIHLDACAAAADRLLLFALPGYGEALYPLGKCLQWVESGRH